MFVTLQMAHRHPAQQNRRRDQRTREPPFAFADAIEPEHQSAERKPR